MKIVRFLECHSRRHRIGCEGTMWRLHSHNETFENKNIYFFKWNDRDQYIVWLTNWPTDRLIDWLGSSVNYTCTLSHLFPLTQMTSVIENPVINFLMPRSLIGLFKKRKKKPRNCIGFWKEKWSYKKSEWYSPLKWIRIHVYTWFGFDCIRNATTAHNY